MDEHLKQLKYLEEQINNNNDYIVNNNNNIDKIVIILGESTQRNYMSIYDYKIKTTPNLEKFKSNGNLFVFNDVISPHTHTNPSIAKILTFSNYENDSTKWFYQKNLINIMKKAGYYTYWISNQESISSLGNAPQALARLCDKNIFFDNFSNGNSVFKDEVILDELKKISRCQKEFFILHLQGTHMDYSKRYNSSFNIFNPNDLEKYNLNLLNSKQKLTNKQALVKSNYLNAILYNDFIVSEIFNYFKNDNSIVFYFSDHADEVYDFRNFFGHTETMLSRYMVEIPFMI
ncbi:phosphoethanolamine transferase, partial [Campylobacter volucris]|uniref:phosphoethanolamine transferase n=1 Tax=Campylobacter volucris TaxID=1031542 RepID=UPI00189EF9CA